jgi:hypothetical protein
MFPFLMVHGSKTANYYYIGNLILDEENSHRFAEVLTENRPAKRTFGPPLRYEGGGYKKYRFLTNSFAILLGVYSTSQEDILASHNWDGSYSWAGEEEWHKLPQFNPLNKPRITLEQVLQMPSK